MAKGKTVQKQREQDGIPDTGVWGIAEGKDRIIITVPLAVSKKGYADLLRLAGNDDAIASGVMSSFLTGLWETIDPLHPERAGGVVLCLQKNLAEIQEEKRARPTKKPETVILPVALSAAAYEKYRRRCIDIDVDDPAKVAAEDLRSLANTYFSSDEQQV